MSFNFINNLLPGDHSCSWVIIPYNEINRDESEDKTQALDVIGLQSRCYLNKSFLNYIYSMCKCN